NPWLWIAVGLGAELLALGCVRGLGEGGGVLRFFLISAGLLSAGAALTLRLRSAGPAYIQELSPSGRSSILIALSASNTLLAVGVTLALIFSFFDFDTIGWNPGQLVIMWFVVVPLSATAAKVCYDRLKRGGNVTRGEEAAALLTLTALCTYLAGWALYRPDAPDEAVTIRLLFAAMTLVALVAAPLVIVPQVTRRAVISGLILLHFAGICTAALAAPPTPWVIAQLWVRIYRPYLEFMYLNNAYHFYAPEPGAASHIWFRVTYMDAQKNKFYQWVKMPDVDLDGKSPRGLAYQRMLAMTENAVNSESRYPSAEALKRRQLAATVPDDLLKGPIGIEKPKLYVPYFPLTVLSQTQQFGPPTPASKRL